MNIPEVKARAPPRRVIKQEVKAYGLFGLTIVRVTHGEYLDCQRWGYL